LELILRLIIVSQGSPPTALFFILKTKIMTPEERQKAISEAFYQISIYAMVTNTCSKEGAHRLNYMLNIINQIPVVHDVDYSNFNHRYYKDILEQAIKDNDKFIESLKSL
jgi:hypothetical protein